MAPIMARATIKIGTRGSPLALAQAHEVRRRLALAHRCEEAAFKIIVIRTSGDVIQDRPLSEVGGKGLFTREIDTAMLRGEIDAAVHSSKDIPTFLPEGIFIAGYLPREDVRDALIAARAGGFQDLPRGATLGTASLRRQAQAKRLRPDLNVVLLRGNVETRLRSAETGAVDATILAYAGLKRLGLAHRATALFETNEFVPAVGQGAIGITARLNDLRTIEAFTPIIDADTGLALSVERAFLAVLDGSCRTPIAGYASVSRGRISFRGMALRVDGSEVYEVEASGDVGAAHEMGEAAGRDLKRRLPVGFFE
jgi:hydroxymethylbilane synthase